MKMTKFVRLLLAYWGSHLRYMIILILSGLFHFLSIYYQYYDFTLLSIPVAFLVILISQYIEDSQLADLLKELFDSALSPSWTARHGSVLTISSFLRHCPSSVCQSSWSSSMISMLKDKLKDEKVQTETSTECSLIARCNKLYIPFLKS